MALMIAPNEMYEEERRVVRRRQSEEKNLDVESSASYQCWLMDVLA